VSRRYSIWKFVVVIVFVAFLAYNCGRTDYTNELAVARSVLKHQKDEAEFFYKKWREEESAHFQTRIRHRGFELSNGRSQP